MKYKLQQTGDEVQEILNKPTATIAQVDAETQRAENVEAALREDITDIDNKIPSAASSSNQLADKAFVNSSVATATATFRGTYNLVTDLQLTTDATHAAIAAMLAQTISTADANDYCFVQVPVSDAQPTVIEVVARYKFGGNGWEFEYDLNNSGFTADQWSAINSHITSGLVTKLDNLPDNAALTTLLNGKQDVISDLSTIREGAAAGATAYQKPVGGIPKTDLASGVQTSLDKADAAAPQSTTYTKTEVDGLVSAEETRARAAEEANASDIDAIEGKIPVAATTENQLADKAFVNSSVATATATFRGTYNLVTDLQLTTDATHAAIAAMLAQTISTADANDYCFVQVPVSDAQPTVIEVVARYKFGGNGWEFEYDLNNSGFTADQWSAINSHITSGLVTKLDNLPDNAALTTLLNGKQDVISDLSTIREGAAAGATAVQPATLDGYYTKSEVDEILRSIAAVAEGYVRVAGSSSPALSYKHYKKEDGDFSAQSVFNIFFPCLVGTPLTGSGTEGKILHILEKFGAQNDNGVVKWADREGVLHNIDGSEGDVIICNIEPYYRIMGKRAVNNVVYDVYLMSVQPFRWQGYESEKVEKCGMSPDYCVLHTDTDDVERMHSVFNPLWEGTRNEVSGCVGKYVYSYDAETGEMVETYDADATLMGDAGGLHTTNLSLPEGEQAAMNNNPDTTKTVPCMNATAAMSENMFAVMLAEGGTFDAHNASLMGSGFCSNDLANTDDDFLASGFDAKNGMRIKDKNDEWQYFGLATSISFLTGSSIHGYNMLNEYANPFRIMEAQRAICYAVKHGVHELEWFAFEGNKYKWRSVDGFLNPTQGEMTCVLWKMFETKAPDTAVDPTDTTTSIAGNRIQLLVSIALYHGVTTQVSPGWWTSGLIITVDNQRTNKCYMQRDQSKLSITPVGEKLVDEEWDFEQTYNHVVDVGYGNHYIMDYNNDALMLPESNDAFGGTLHTYVCQHKRFNSSRAPSGKKMVRGFVRGGSVSFSDYSPLLVYASNSPSLANSHVGFGICYQIVD